MGAKAPARPTARRRIGVAVSGGRDSTALWHATARQAAVHPGLEVIGLHVHHGLMAQADDWLTHLRRQARRWAGSGLPVSLQCHHLTGAPSRGDSTEAWARRERYGALADMAKAQGIDLVLLAHHRRDQAETFLLQAMRGAGPAGLSAMPLQARRQGIDWVRPWLEQPRKAIEAYVRRYRLGFIDDASNGDTRWARNRLRLDVWPALQHAFAGSDERLAASALRAQEAAACLRELADLDLQTTRTGDGRLQRAAWIALSEARRANLMRAWLSAWATDGVPETLVHRLLRELPRAETARWPLGGGELRLYRGHLAFVVSPERATCSAAPKAMQLDLSRPGRVEVPEWRGAFDVGPVLQRGVEPRLLRRCELRARSGAERFQRGPATVARSLKKQYQSAGLPSWARDGPLVFASNELLYAPGLGIDARRQALPGTPMLGLHWLAG